MRTQVTEWRVARGVFSCPRNASDGSRATISETLRSSTSTKSSLPSSVLASGAKAKPAHGRLQFADDGSVRFDAVNSEAGSCLVRMQRIAELLVVEDNGHCGGSMVTFTGFYRRKS